MNSITMRGASAELKWSYHSAAVLRSWAITGTTATAQVVSVDEFKASQRPLTFVAHTPSGHQWKWAVTSLQIAGDTVTCALAEE